MGIPFLIQTAVQAGGGWNISSTVPGGETVARFGGKVTDCTCTSRDAGHGKAAGTTVEAWFDLANMDTPPVGDIPGLFRTVLLFTGPEEVVLKRSRKGIKGKTDLDYEVKKTELAEALGGDLEDVSSLVLLGQYFRSLEGEDEE